MSGLNAPGNHETVADGETGSSRDGSPPSSFIPVTRTRLELPVGTIAKVLVTLALLWFVYRTHDILFVVFLGLLLAVVLDRPVSWLQAHGFRRSLAMVVVLGTVIGAATLLLALVAPRVAEDVRGLWQQLPTYIEEGSTWFQGHFPALYDRVLAWAEGQREGLKSGSFNVRGILNQGVNVVSALGNVVVMLITAVYMLADQGRSLDGVTRHLSPSLQEKVRRTKSGVSGVIYGYVVGQTINSLLFGLFSLVVLSILDVPSAIALALFAAIGDAIPQVGVIIATIPAVILAFTISLQTAIIVVVAYVIYQQVENYITSPRVFGKTLDLSPLVTLLAVLIGGSLLGIIGVLLALPVAAVSVLVRIWLGEGIEPKVAADGDQLARD